MNRDPRYRARLNQISSTLESANLNTQASLWSFKETYLLPCLASAAAWLESTCYPCIGERRERARARQRRSAAAARGRPEFVFDFYNDEWDTDGDGEDERTGLLGAWGVDELDRLLAGSGTGGRGDRSLAEDGIRQPKRAPRMNYGATSASGLARRRRSTLLAAQGNDPTILPGSSMFGFLERLPWKIGGRGVRYKPSAADLQENPGGRRKRGGGHGQKDSKGDIDHEEIGDSMETSALLEDEENSDSDHGNNQSNHRHQRKQPHRRNRSDTTTSGSTQASLSSRGDLFPSEDEAADAVPLDDSFALSFARRSSDGEHDSQSYTTTDHDSQSRRTRSTKSPSSNNHHHSHQHNRPRRSTLNRRRSEQTPSITSPDQPRPSKPPKPSKPRRTRTGTTSVPGTAMSPTSATTTTSEMALQSPLTPLTPTGGTGSGSGGGGASGGASGGVGSGTSRASSDHDLSRSAFSFLHSDYENEADESALVSPVAERIDAFFPPTAPVAAATSAAADDHDHDDEYDNVGNAAGAPGAMIQSFSSLEDIARENDAASDIGRDSGLELRLRTSVPEPEPETTLKSEPEEPDEQQDEDGDKGKGKES